MKNRFLGFKKWRGLKSSLLSPLHIRYKIVLNIETIDYDNSQLRGLFVEKYTSLVISFVVPPDLENYPESLDLSNRTVVFGPIRQIWEVPQQRVARVYPSEVLTPEQAQELCIRGYKVYDNIYDHVETSRGIRHILRSSSGRNVSSLRVNFRRLRNQRSFDKLWDQEDAILNPFAFGEESFS